jgi:hypothetical protein
VANVTGSVADPSGARLPHALVHIDPAPTNTPRAPFAPQETFTDPTGSFSFTLPPGTYDVTIVADGFDPLLRSLVVPAGPLNGPARSAHLDATLIIATQSEKVDVSANSAASTAAADNQSALVFKGSDLDALSTDDATFQQEITAMAGGSGDNGAQIFVDGFSGGQFPPKNTIREVRINQNPFSAQYDGLGFGRVEVFTKPGTDKFHGSFFANGNDAPFNARNPYAGAQPPYYSVFSQGNINGPIDKKTSFFLSGRYNNTQSNAVINAVNPDGTPLTQALPDPSINSNFSLRLDRQLTANNTFTSRYSYDNSTQTNSGIGQLVLASQGVATHNTTQTLQLGNTQVIGTKIVSESRFQYIRTRSGQTPVSNAPSIIVQGSFSGGGSSSGTSHDNQDRYEFQQYLSIVKGSHFLRIGGRYRLQRDANVSQGNYNGQFVFPTLASYNANHPSQFSITQGQPFATVLTGDLGLYAEDEWKAAKNVTLNYGLRFETQSAVPDHFDPAPRVGAAWAIGKTDKHAPLVTLRAGAGLFYNRFNASSILTAIRQNGVSQQSYFIANPTFYPNIPTSSQLSSGTASTPYRIDPNLRTAYRFVAGLTAERSIGKIGNISVNYLNIRGVHQYNSFNINAPLPGTYNPATPTSGTRPLGGSQNIYQFSSEGIDKEQTVFINSNLHPGKRIFFFGSYVATMAHADSAGAGSFPSQPYNLSADYSAGGNGVAQRAFLGGELEMPLGISLGVFTSIQSRQRFNITTGTDLNGDTIYNDRPAFATAPTANSVLYNTPFGNFDANPQPGEPIIPYNYGKGAGLFFSDLNLSKDFQFGPRPPSPPPPPSAAPKGAPTGKAAAPPAPPRRPDPPYTLSFGLDASNAINHVNPGPPVGILSSPLFGRANSLAGFFGNSSSANRTVSLHTFFRF